MSRCDNDMCSRTAEHELIYGFEVGPRLKNNLCGPCRDMLIEGSHAVDIEEDS